MAEQQSPSQSLSSTFQAQTILGRSEAAAANPTFGVSTRSRGRISTQEVGASCALSTLCSIFFYRLLDPDPWPIRHPARF